MQTLEEEREEREDNLIRAGRVVVQPDGFTTHEVLGDVGSVTNAFASGCVAIFVRALHTDLLDVWWTNGSAVRELSRMIQSVEDRVLPLGSQRASVSLTRFAFGIYRVDVHIRQHACSASRSASRSASPVFFFPFEE